MKSLYSDKHLALALVANLGVTYAAALRMVAADPTVAEEMLRRPRTLPLRELIARTGPAGPR